MRKNRFTTDLEPSFPDIRKAFTKFKNIIEDDDELKEVFPHGIRHFQVSQRRGAKNIKELLAPLSLKMTKTPSNSTDEIDPNNGSHPCGKPCVCCKFLSETESYF